MIIYNPLNQFFCIEHFTLKENWDWKQLYIGVLCIHNLIITFKYDIFSCLFWQKWCNPCETWCLCVCFYFFFLVFWVFFWWGTTFPKSTWIGATSNFPKPIVKKLCWCRLFLQNWHGPFKTLNYFFFFSFRVGTTFSKIDLTWGHISFAKAYKM